VALITITNGLLLLLLLLLVILMVIPIHLQ